MNAASSEFTKYGEYVAGWLDSESARHDRIGVQRLLIDMNNGNLIDGIILSRIVYWFSRAKNGQVRAKIVRDGFTWIAKEYDEWWLECRIDPRTARASITRMCESSLLVKTVYKFNGKPTVHLRINWDEFIKRRNFYSELATEEKKSLKKSKRHQMSKPNDSVLSSNDTPEIQLDVKTMGMTSDVNSLTIYTASVTAQDTDLSATLNAGGVAHPDPVAETLEEKSQAATTEQGEVSPSQESGTSFTPVPPPPMVSPVGQILVDALSVPINIERIAAVTKLFELSRAAKALPKADDYPPIVAELRKIDPGEYGPSDAMRLFAEWKNPPKPALSVVPRPAPQAQSSSNIASILHTEDGCEITYRRGETVFAAGESYDNPPAIPFAITVEKQYAERIAAGSKRYEVRKFNPKYRGPLVVTVSKAKHAICMVDLVDVVLADSVPELTPEERAFGKWAWILKNPRYVQPVATKGQLGIWEWSGELPNVITAEQYAAERAAKVKPPKAEPMFSDEIKNAMAITCYGSVDAWKIDTNAKLMMKSMKQINAAGAITIEKQRVYLCNWRKKDFRAKGGKLPTPYQVVETWIEYTTEDCDGLIATFTGQQDTTTERGFGDVKPNIDYSAPKGW